MPVGKYYCDYCDKYLQDTRSARKRHLLGLSHQRARSLWYQSSSSSNPPLAVCHHFVRTVRCFITSIFQFPLLFFCLIFSLSLSLPKGFCQYGDACKYFHPPLPQPLPGLSFLSPYPAFFCAIIFFPLTSMYLLSIIDLYTFPQPQSLIFYVFQMIHIISQEKI